MIYNINEELTNLIETRKIINSIIKDIEIKTSEYERLVEPLKKELIIKREELDLIKSNTIQVRLGDLIGELAWLSGVNTENISTSIKFNLIFSGEEELFNLIDIVRNNEINCLVDNVRFKLSGNLDKRNKEGVSFDYFKFLLLDLAMIQNDGKKLIEHCSFEIETFSSGELSVLFSIDKDINDIYCDFSFEIFESIDNKSWYPADLFVQAVINCSQRNYSSKVDKIRKKSMFR